MGNGNGDVMDGVVVVVGMMDSALVGLDIEVTRGVVVIVRKNRRNKYCDIGMTVLLMIQARVSIWIYDPLQLTLSDPIGDIF